jgi:gliding motility-associated-like protein
MPTGLKKVGLGSFMKVWLKAMAILELFNMQLKNRHLFILVFVAANLTAQQGAFIENKGQWDGAFDFRLQMHKNYIFFKSGETAFLMHQSSSHATEHAMVHHNSYGDSVAGHVYKSKLVGANRAARVLKGRPQNTRHNFLKGRNPKRWKSRVKGYFTWSYENIYPKINQKFRMYPGGYKYDFVVQPGGRPSQIKIEYTGADTLALLEGNLLIKTSVATLQENRPVAYWLSADGQRNPVDCAYQLKKNVLSFIVGEYPAKAELIIDPQLVFSTYSGATADNWGFTATPAANDGAYGGGVIFDLPGSSNYPTTAGAFQTVSAGGDVDIAISKFSGDGKQLTYSTYLGGNSIDVPISTLEGPNQSLIILGVTGSLNFPVTASAYDSSFLPGAPRDLRQAGLFRVTNGSHLFITILDSTGGALEGSTLLGDTALDAINRNLHFNFGDEFRGNLAQDTAGNIYFVTNTFSDNLSKGNSVFQPLRGGLQDGLAGRFNADLSNLDWATYVGGSADDALFSLTLTPSGRLYLCGATESTDMSLSGGNAHQSSPAGKVDGLLLELDTANGALLNYTYAGTPEDDLSYFTSADGQGNLAVFGQTYGAWPLEGLSLYRDSGSAQFLQRYSPDLSQLQRSTVFGTGQNNQVNISPTALLIDNCNNLLLSGFMPQPVIPSRGSPASVSNNAQLPLKNALRTTLYDLDFYFFALDPSWENLIFASFFGDTTSFDHVDGGSSRFRKDGSIIQGVCASCGGISDFFPTTDDAYSNLNGSNNCNLAVFRFDFEVTQAKAVALVEAESVDSACIPYTSLFIDDSRNADFVIITYPDGTRDTAKSGAISITDTGYTRVKFLAVDTVCNTVDSTFLDFYGVDSKVEANFNYQYDSCQAGGLVSFNNTSAAADAYTWILGNGDTLTQANPQYTYEPGTYVITLIATNTFCQRSDTLKKTINVTQRDLQASLQTSFNPCALDSPATFRVLNRGYQVFEWQVNGQPLMQNTDSLSVIFTEPGRQTVSLRLLDTLCGEEQTIQRELNYFAGEVALQMPNIFTPNGDGFNDSFGPLEMPVADYFSRYSLEVYDRNGRRIFATDNPAEYWNGRIEGDLAQETVFFYLLEYQDRCGNTQRLKGFTHLSY